MASFALIAEGITDQAVLENILIGVYGDDVEVNPLQPLRDATDTNRAKPDCLGGWEQVFEFCQHESFGELLMFNDYVIIQLDTDVGEHINFGVPLTHNGQDRPVNELVDSVRELLISKLNPVSYQQNQSAFLFAIAVHSTDCWLLPLYATEKAHLSKTKNCANQLLQLPKLQREIEKRDMNYKKTYRVYDALSSRYRNLKELSMGSQQQKSLALFLDSLPSLSEV